MPRASTISPIRRGRCAGRPLSGPLQFAQGCGHHIASALDQRLLIRFRTTPVHFDGHVQEGSMLPRPEPACLVIADISGYTGYLAGVELDHAQDILADLIDTIVGALRPPFL